MSVFVSPLLKLSLPIKIDPNTTLDIAHLKNSEKNYVLSTYQSPIGLVFIHLYALQQNNMGLSFCEICSMPFVVQRFRPDSQNPNEWRLKRTCYSKCKNAKFPTK